MIGPMDMSHRRILVTGASSGIGRATSVLLSQLGAEVVLVARSEQRLTETAQRMEGKGHVVLPKDLHEADEIPIWMKQLVADDRPLHGLVHCAGIQQTKPVRFLKDKDVCQLMSVNFNSAVQLARGFRQKSVSVKPASLVLLSSVIGMVGQAGVAAYAASKGAIRSLTQSLAMEFAPEGIRVNCIAPGVVQTEMTESFRSTLSEEQFEAVRSRHPLGIGQPIDVAHAAAFLLADTGKWITGTTLVVDGGYTAH